MPTEEGTDWLLRKLAAGETSAGNRLLHRHRARLTRMVAMRLDPRLRGRFDPSDVVQEALLIANERLVSYAQHRPIPFYPWLRGIAWQQLLKFHERHVRAQKRSVHRESQQLPELNDESINELAQRLVSEERSPSEHVSNMEQRARVRRALDTLKPRDREVVELRYLEQLNTADIAAVLGVSVGAVRTRHFRAIQRLHQALQGDSQT